MGQVPKYLTAAVIAASILVAAPAHAIEKEGLLADCTSVHQRIAVDESVGQTLAQSNRAGRTAHEYMKLQGRLHYDTTENYHERTARIAALDTPTLFAAADDCGVMIQEIFFPTPELYSQD